MIMFLQLKKLKKLFLIIQAVSLFEKNTSKSTLKALKKLGKVALVIPKAVLDCKASSSDLKNLTAAIASMSNPVSFVYHVGKDIILNGV